MRAEFIMLYYIVAITRIANEEEYIISSNYLDLLIPNDDGQATEILRLLENIENIKK